MKAEQGHAELTWTTWPAAKRPWLTAAVVAFCLGFAALAWQSLGSRWYAVIALVVLAGASAPYLFPQRYELDAEGVRIRHFLGGKQRRWEELRTCFEGCSEGLLLCPYALPGEGVEGPPPPRNWPRLIGRSLVLYSAEADAEAVKAFVAEYLPIRDSRELIEWMKARR